ncbi:hypothetical protein ACFLZM_08030 [Thermodesulfobacteriota bacterium]
MENLPFMSLGSFLNGDNPRMLVYIDSVPAFMREGYQTRNYNVEKGSALCDHCHGTGHEYTLCYMEDPCPVCEGTGRSDDQGYIDGINRRVLGEVLIAG